MTACARQVVLALLSPVLRRAGRAFLAGPRVRARRRTAAGGPRLLRHPRLLERPGRPAAAVEVELAALAVLPGRPRIGVKAPVLDFESAAVERLAHAARGAGVGLVLDSHAPADADATLALACKARATGAVSRPGFSGGSELTQRR